MSNVTYEHAADKKLGELILYIAKESEGDEPFGATKLNKLLFFSDFLAFSQFGESITAQAYQKLEHGPCPRRLIPVMQALESSGSAVQRLEVYFARPKRRAMAVRCPDLTVFSGREIDLVRDVIKHFWGKAASYVSKESHRFRGWRLAKHGEDIPYELARMPSRKPTAKEFERARALKGPALARLSELSG